MAKKFGIGLCACGCGQTTKIAPYSHKARGWVKGQPKRFVKGHTFKNTQYERTPIEVRFWLHVDKNGSNGCWNWTGNPHKDYYGNIWYKKTYTLSHRVSWELANGPIPEGMQVLHKCDNKRCVNPDHLFLGTQADNVHDGITKGRIRLVTMPGRGATFAALEKGTQSWLIPGSLSINPQTSTQMIASVICV